jgi:hypothetical protein
MIDQGMLTTTIKLWKVESGELKNKKNTFSFSILNSPHFIISSSRRTLDEALLVFVFFYTPNLRDNNYF